MFPLYANATFYFCLIFVAFHKICWLPFFPPHVLKGGDDVMGLFQTVGWPGLESGLL